MQNKIPEVKNAPAGKHVFGLVRVNAKGQIVIPIKARKMFDIKEGDQLLLLGDEQQGLAIAPKKQTQEMLAIIFGDNNDSDKN